MPTPGTYKAAQVLTNDNGFLETRYGTKTTEGIADLIDRECHVTELTQALQGLYNMVQWLQDSGNLKSPIEPHPYGMALIQAKQQARSVLDQVNKGE